MKLSDVKRANKEWFSRGNKKFFNDISYRLAKVGGNYYLVIETFGWTDMFGGPRKRHFRVKHINPDLSLGSMLDEVFPSITEAREFLKLNGAAKVNESENQTKGGES